MTFVLQDGLLQPNLLLSAVVVALIVVVVGHADDRRHGHLVDLVEVRLFLLFDVSSPPSVTNLSVGALDLKHRDNECCKLLSHIEQGGNPIPSLSYPLDSITSLLYGRYAVLGTYSIASVQADIDGSFEEDVITLREFERLELGTQRIAVVGEEVLEEVWVHRASEIQKFIVIIICLLFDIEILYVSISQSFFSQMI